MILRKFYFGNFVLTSKNSNLVNRLGFEIIHFVQSEHMILKIHMKKVAIWLVAKFWRGFRDCGRVAKTCISAKVIWPHLTSVGHLTPFDLRVVWPHLTSDSFDPIWPQGHFSHLTSGSFDPIWPRSSKLYELLVVQFMKSHVPS